MQVANYALSGQQPLGIEDGLAPVQTQPDTLPNHAGSESDSDHANKPSRKARKSKHVRAVCGVSGGLGGGEKVLPWALTVCCPLMLQSTCSNKQGRLASEITKHELQSLYYLNAEEAATALGIGLTALKNVCRGQDIQRWPYRRVKRIEQSAAKVLV